MAARQDNEQVAALVRRMWEAGCARARDSSTLSEGANTQSDSDHLLGLLGFEILLKAAHLAHVGAPPHRHDYRKLFEALPEPVQDGLIQAAEARMSTAADYSDLPGLLTTFSTNFVNLRYSYERHKECSNESYAELVQSWLSRGAPESEADFVYHPQELFGLTVALQDHLKSWLAS